MECISNIQQSYDNNKNEKINMLLYNNRIAEEIRPAYFLQAFDKDILPMRIFSFGTCNLKCPYCKRDGQHVDRSGNIISSVDVSQEQLFEKIDIALKNKEVIRLSGGDPCCYPNTSKAIFKYVKEHGGTCSIAHNGSSPIYIKSIMQYLDFAAIDFKACTIKEYAKRTGTSIDTAQSAMRNSLITQKILSENNILVDIRTCVFLDTTLQDLLELADKICGSGNIMNKFWTIRNYNTVDFCNWKPRDITKTIEDIKIVKQRFPNLKIGLRAKWEATGFLYF